MAAARISSITIKTDRVREVARFWRDMLGLEVAPNHSSSVRLIGPEGPALLIQPSDDPSELGAIHLDLRPDDQRACIELALGLGASYADVGQSGDEGWTVLADPGGNLFCVLQGQRDLDSFLQRDPGNRTPID